MAHPRKAYPALVAALLLAGLVQLEMPTPAHAAPSATGGVTLDGYGGIHPFGGLNLNTASAPYWSGFDIARAVVLRQDGSGGWTLDGYGGIHAFGAAPAIQTPAYWGWDIARAFVVTSRDANGVLDGRQGYVLDGYGGAHPWGGAPALSAPYPGRDVTRGLEVHFDGTGKPDGGWSMDWRGRITAFGAASVLPATGLPRAPIFQQLHGTASGGYVVPKWGVITTYGSGISPSWSGYSDWGSWDILRDLVLVNPSNPSPTAQPSSAAAASTYQAWLRPHGGVVLDGWGGVHPWGGAPTLTGAPYTPYQDVARGLEIHYAANGVPDGGWAMDRWGRVTAFGAAAPLTVGGLPNSPVMQQLHAVGGGGFALAKWGSTSAYGSVAPYWTGYADWGAWDILRDLVLVDPTNPSPGAQPISSGASGRLSGAVNLQYTISDRLIAQSHNLDCESAALRMALFVPGTNASENWILAQMGADLRRAVMDQFGDVLRWGDPYATFVGNVNGLEYNGTGYGVYYPPIAMAAGRAGRSTLAKEGWNPHDLYVEVASGNPAVVWVPVYGYWQTAMRTWTAWDGRQIRYTLVEHAMTLIGVNAAARTVTLNDPNRGYVRTVSMTDFEAAFAKFNNMAVVVY